MPHVHVSALEGTVLLAYLIILTAAWRTTSAYLAEYPVGQAMAFVGP